jgi:hypothetical protein
MMDAAPNTGRPRLDKPRSRRDAAKMLGIALQTRYRKLLEATGEDEIVVATADLAQCMYENVEFVVWALKSLGGMHPPPPEELRKISPMKVAANDDPRFAKPPPVEFQGSGHSLDLGDCTCPPIEPGIIGGDRHMTSCPKYVP